MADLLQPRVTRNLNRILLLCAFFLQFACVYAQEASSFNPSIGLLPKRGMWSERPATRWQEAFVTGNGTLGAMVFGDPSAEKIVLNHERLYEPLLDQPCPVPDVADALPETRRLYLEGKFKEGYLHYFEAAKANGFPGIQWTDPYHPACRLEIDQPEAEVHQQYCRSTDFNSGVTAVHWHQGKDQYSRETFASRPDGVIVTRIASSTGASIKGLVRLVNQDSRAKNKRTDKFGGGYEDPTIEAGEGWLAYRCKYARSKRGYQVIARIVADGKPADQANDGSISFDCNEAIILIEIQSLEEFAGADAAMSKAKQKLSSIKPDFNAILNRHEKVHGEMMNRVQLDLQLGEEARLLSAEDLIEAQCKTVDTELNLILLQKMFDMGRYALVSSSGEWPPNLMGIWNGEWRPRWSGDFTLDANVNLQIAAANIGNLPEAIESYDQLIHGLVEDWKVNAKNLYGCRGVLAGCRTDGRHNLHTHYSEGFPGCSWVSGAQWLVLPMFEHWQTTGDEEYLKEKLLPLMKEIALFYEDYLGGTEDGKGNLTFVPSYSPENKPTGASHSSVINATMDIACCKEVLTQLLDLEAGYLGEDERNRYRSLLGKLPKYMVNDDGALKEWAHPDLKDNYDHRHVSHLYPVWPGHEVNPEDTPELFEAAKVAAEKRGRGNGSAHGLAHMALIGTRLKDADLVEGNLRFMLGSGFVLPSLCTFHNESRIYNMDMLNSLPAVVLESLVYSKPGEIELFPALPNSMSAGSVTGIACRNRTVIESLSWDFSNRKVVAKIRSNIDQTIVVRVRAGRFGLTQDMVVKLELKSGKLEELKIESKILKKRKPR